MSATGAPDARVAAAIAHWGPRLIANGVDYNDFVRTTARITSWADWCAEWMRTAEQHEALAAEAEARGGRLSAAEARLRAALCYHFGKFLFFDDPAQALVAHERMMDCAQRAAPDLDPPAERVEIPFEGLQLPGYLRKPSGGDRPGVVLVAPGLDSTKEEFLGFSALFLARGLAVLLFDGPGQGEVERLAPIRPDYERVVNSLIDWLQDRPDLDARRVGLAGVSLGGYYAARAAAYEPRLRGAVCLAGPFNFGDCWDRLPGLTRAAFAARSGATNPDDARRRAAQLSLEQAAPLIQVPLLVIHGQRDDVVPVEEAHRLHAAAAVADRQLVVYPDGNHVCNNLPYAYRPLIADWLAERLRPGD